MKKIFILISFALFFSCIDNKPYSPDFSTTKGKKEFSSKAWIISQSFIKQKLISPSTANFPLYDYSFSEPKSDKSIIIKSYVDSQNNFGAIVRKTFYINIKYNSGDWADPTNWIVLNIEFK